MTRGLTEILHHRAVAFLVKAYTNSAGRVVSWVGTGKAPAVCNFHGHDAFQKVFSVHSEKLAVSGRHFSPVIHWIRVHMTYF